MHLIVDGYNLIGRSGGLRGELLPLRRRLIESLSMYRRHKGHPITVVFDGRGEHFSDEGVKSGGLSVVFSRDGETADEVIIRMAQSLGPACTVVSSDREVQRRIRCHGGTAIFAGEFEARLRAVLESSTLPVAEEEEEDRPDRTTQKRGNPKRPSKAERQRQKRLRRL